MLFQCSELLTWVHVCMFAWLRAGEALTSLASLPRGTMSVARSLSRGSHATSTLASKGSSAQRPTDETFARGSSESPCRAVRLVNFPRDGHAPSACATGSDEFPPKSSGAPRSGIDEAMGPWLCPQEEEVLLLAQQTVHMDPECSLINRRTYPLQMCYCVTKLHRCFHYDVDSDFVLHSNCRCSENVDVATDKVWPVVIMCRRCSPFPERLIEGNSQAHN